MKKHLFLTFVFMVCTFCAQASHPLLDVFTSSWEDATKRLKDTETWDMSLDHLVTFDSDETSKNGFFHEKRLQELRLFGMMHREKDPLASKKAFFAASFAGDGGSMLFMAKSFQETPKTLEKIHWALMAMQANALHKPQFYIYEKAWDFFIELSKVMSKGAFPDVEKKKKKQLYKLYKKMASVNKQGHNCYQLCQKLFFDEEIFPLISKEFQHKKNTFILRRYPASKESVLRSFQDLCCFKKEGYSPHDTFNTSFLKNMYDLASHKHALDSQGTAQLLGQCADFFGASGLFGDFNTFYDEALYACRDGNASLLLEMAKKGSGWGAQELTVELELARFIKLKYQYLQARSSQKKEGDTTAIQEDLKTFLANEDQYVHKWLKDLKNIPSDSARLKEGVIYQNFYKPEKEGYEKALDAYTCPKTPYGYLLASHIYLETPFLEENEKIMGAFRMFLMTESALQDMVDEKTLKTPFLRREYLLVDRISAWDLYKDLYYKVIDLSALKKINTQSIIKRALAFYENLPQGEDMSGVSKIPASRA